MIIAEGELGLILEIEVSREVLQGGEDFLCLFFTNDFCRGIKLAEVMLISAEKAPEDSTRGSGSTGIKTIADRGVEAGKRVLLGFFKYGKEAAKAVTGIGVGFV